MVVSIEIAKFKLHQYMHQWRANLMLTKLTHYMV